MTGVDELMMAGQLGGFGGIPVVRTDAVPPGRILVGDFDRGARIFAPAPPSEITMLVRHALRAALPWFRDPLLTQPWWQSLLEGEELHPGDRVERSTNRFASIVGLDQ